MEIKDKTILITGGARVGQFVAEELLAAGTQVAMTYMKDASEAHPKSKGYQADFTNEESVRTLFANVTKDSGHVDALVNMVSVFSPDKEIISFADMAHQFSINAYGNMFLSRLFAESAKQAGATGAPIVSFIDWAIDHPYAGYDVYMASKAALRHYVMALQTSFAGSIRVVNIHPGMILEPEGFSSDVKQSIVNNTPTQNIGTPQQAASLVRQALQLDFLADNIYLAGGQQWRHRLKSG